MNACFEIHFEKARRIYGDDVNSILCTLKDGKWSFEPLKDTDYHKVVDLFKEGVSQKDIAAQLGISPGWVSKLLKKARESGEI
jgi:putative DNA primase/helicase